MEEVQYVSDAEKESDVCQWERLTSALQEYILARVPIDDVIRLQLVKKDWQSLIRAPRFKRFYDEANTRSPWFFLQCVNILDPLSDRTFIFNPEKDKWYVIREPHQPPYARVSIATSADGMIYTTLGGTEFCYSRNLFTPWVETARMKRERNSPLVSMWKPEGEGQSSSAHKLIAVGGFLWGLEGFYPDPEYLFADTDDELAVEVYDSISNEWTEKESLPREYVGWSSRDLLCGAVWESKLFVLHLYDGLLTVFDLEAETWSPVMELRPSERPSDVKYAHLVVWSGMLILAGVHYESREGVSFKLWHVDHNVVNDHTMQCREMITMPSELFVLFTRGDGRRVFLGLECRADDSYLYVYNASPEDDRSHPIVACSFLEGRCSWRKLPDLPLQPGENRFDKMVAFCSSVRLESQLV